jgi:hypothetical protein
VFHTQLSFRAMILYPVWSRAPLLQHDSRMETEFLPLTLYVHGWHSAVPAVWKICCVTCSAVHKTGTWKQQSFN